MDMLQEEWEPPQVDDYVVNILSGVTGRVIKTGGCTTVELDDGKCVRGDFRAWAKIEPDTKETGKETSN